MAKRLFFVPWQAFPPIGAPTLQELAHDRFRRVSAMEAHGRHRRGLRVPDTVTREVVIELARSQAMTWG
jgi:hypothetical protein